MSAIVPAILPTSHADLREKLCALHTIGADHVQVDIVDGNFSTPPSWPYASKGERGSIAREIDRASEDLGDIHLEMDLMVSNPETEFSRWIEAGANRITVHAESTRLLPKILADFHTTYGYDKDFAPGLLAFGLAINIATDISLIEPFLDKCDYVQFMGISHIGRQGEPFDKKVLAKISAFRKKYPSIPMQVDGGVSLTTAPALLDAGVSRLIVGSALWKAPDLATAYNEFLELTTRYGVYE